MRAISFYVALCALAAVTPLLPRASRAHQTTDAFAWPAQFQGRPLTELPLTGRDRLRDRATARAPRS